MPKTILVGLPDTAVKESTHRVERAMTLATAGAHNLIMVGPPGSGSTMLTKRMPTILPPRDVAKSIDSSSAPSDKGLPNGRRMTRATARRGSVN